MRGVGIGILSHFYFSSLGQQKSQVERDNSQLCRLQVRVTQPESMFKKTSITPKLLIQSHNNCKSRSRLILILKLILNYSSVKRLPTSASSSNLAFITR